MTRGRLDALLLFAALGLASCGSPIETTLSNGDACRMIRVALDGQCTGAERIGWLNCAMLPGCPGGDVSRSHVEVCIGRIGSSVSCDAARLLECTIPKVGCLDEAAPFETACANLEGVLEARGCSTAEFQCGDYVACGDKVEMHRLGGCIDVADEAAQVACCEGAATDDVAKAACKVDQTGGCATRTAECGALAAALEGCLCPP